MTRDPRLYLQDILDSIDKIQRYIAGLTYEEFEKNDLIIDAVARNFGIIGESATQLQNEIKDRYPDVPWYQMKGLRNIITHEYFGVRLATIWKTACEDLPQLKIQICEILSELK